MYYSIDILYDISLYEYVIDERKNSKLIFVLGVPKMLGKGLKLNLFKKKFSQELPQLKVKKNQEISNRGCLNFF